jgi:hypothetical protein
MPIKNELKINGNQVLWWNGEKWLVKETLKTVSQAKNKLNELNLRKNG